MVVRRVIATTPRLMRGRRGSSGVMLRVRSIEPKTIIMMAGESRSILASGARVRERKLASAIADACSERPGRRRSKKRMLAGDTGLVGRLGSLWTLLEVNCPV